MQADEKLNINKLGPNVRIDCCTGSKNWSSIITWGQKGMIGFTQDIKIQKQNYMYYMYY